MFTLDDIHLYIFNWNKTTNNCLNMYNHAIKYINNIVVINCDENYRFNDNIFSINLDDSYYYGGQYQIAINDVKKNTIFGVIVGDTINIDFKTLFQKLLYTFNNYNMGIYTINDIRSNHKTITNNVCNIHNLKIVENTDCGIWFIHPEIVHILKNINYHKLSPLGWGIDIITIRECRKYYKLVIRDYSLKSSQLDFTTNYDEKKALMGMKKIIKYYETYINKY